MSVISNVAWTVTVMQEGNWLTVTPTNGSSTVTVTLMAQPNTGAARTASISIAGEGVDWPEIISVTQKGYRRRCQVLYPDF